MSAVRDENILELDCHQVLNGFVNINGTRMPIGSFPFVIRGSFDPKDLRGKLSRAADMPVTQLSVDKQTPHSPILQRNSKTSVVRVEEMVKRSMDVNHTTAYSYRADAHSDFWRTMTLDTIFGTGMSWFNDKQVYNPDASFVMVGSYGNLTPLHHDWWHSTMVQFDGTKAVHLCSIMDAQEIQQGWDVPAWYELEPGDYVDREQILSVESGCRATLDAGDLLYIPPFWYHQVCTLSDRNVSLSIRHDCQTHKYVPDLLVLSQNNTLRRMTKEKLTPVQIANALYNNTVTFNESMKEVWHYMFNHDMK